MKKTLWLLLFSTLIISACQKDETGDFNDIERQEEIPLDKEDEIDIP